MAAESEVYSWEPHPLHPDGTEPLHRIAVDYCPEACLHERHVGEIHVTYDHRGGARWRSERRFRPGGAVAATIRAPAGDTSGLNYNIYLSSLEGSKDQDEIDFEFLGHDKRAVQTNYHVGGEGGREQTHALPFDSSDGFHHYAIAWDAARIEWRVDGELIRRHERRDGEPWPEKPMYLYASVWDASYIADGKWIRSIGGGCINSAQRYDTDVGPFCVKSNSRIGPEMFEGEALGLKAMYDTKSIRVPLPYKVGVLPSGGSFIIMEFIEFGPSRGDQSVLGRKLAEMHKAAKSDQGYGFPVDNTIGSTPQINTWTADWIEFYSKHRLGYQLELISRRYGDSAIYEKGQRLIKNIRPLFDGAVIEPCLLHGDLWSGNISSDSKGDPVILDPACYYGHNEAEFGMSWCAGFGGDFYNAYFQVMPKQPGFEKRRDLYLLYHYLNHYNLFGSGYRSSAMSIIEDYLYVLAA